MSKKTTAPTTINKAPMIQIGCSEKSVEAARAAINDILASPSADAAKVEALKTLNTLCGVNGTTITGCHLSN